MSHILPFSDDVTKNSLESPLINNEENISYLNFNFNNLSFCNFNNLRYNFKKLYRYTFCIPNMDMDMDMESSDEYQNLNFNNE